MFWKISKTFFAFKSRRSIHSGHIFHGGTQEEAIGNCRFLVCNICRRRRIWVSEAKNVLLFSCLLTHTTLSNTDTKCLCRNSLQKAIGKNVIDTGYAYVTQ